MLGKSGTERHYFGLRKGCVLGEKKKKKELLLFLLPFFFSFIVLYDFIHHVK